MVGQADHLMNGVSCELKEIKGIFYPTLQHFRYTFFGLWSQRHDGVVAEHSLGTTAKISRQMP